MKIKFWFFIILEFLSKNKIQLYSQSLKSFFQYGNVLVHDHDQDLAEISTNLAAMTDQEQKCLELMEYKHDVLRTNVRILYCWFFAIFERRNWKLSFTILFEHE